MKLKLLFLALILLPSFGFAQNRITLTVTVTNNPSQGNLFTVNADGRTWTTNQTGLSASQIKISTNGVISASATNLYTALAANLFAGQFTVVQTETNIVKVYGSGGQALAASLSGNWAALSVATNAVTDMTVVRIPVSSEATASVKTNIASQLIAAINSFATNKLSLGVLDISGTLTNLASVGSGTSLVSSVSASTGNLKSLTPGSGISFSGTGTNITISSAGALNADSVTNLTTVIPWLKWDVATGNSRILQTNGTLIPLRTYTDGNASLLTGFGTNLIALTSLRTNAATTGQVLKYDGTFWAAGTDSTGGGGSGGGDVFTTSNNTFVVGATNIFNGGFKIGSLTASSTPLQTLIAAPTTNLIIQTSVGDVIIEADAGPANFISLWNAGGHQQKVFAGSNVFFNPVKLESTFKLTSGAQSGYVLTATNAAGDAGWAAAAAGGSGLATNDAGYLRVALNDFKSKNTQVTKGFTGLLPSISAGSNARVQNMRIVNTTSSAVTYDISVFTGIRTNKLEELYTLAPNSMKDYENICVENGGFIQGKASVAAGVFAQVSYVEETNSVMSGKAIAFGTVPTNIIATVSAGNRARIHSLFIHNTNTLARTFTIDWLDKTAGTTFSLYSNFNINPKTSVIIKDLNFETGGSLTGYSTNPAGNIEAIVTYETRGN